MPDLNIPEDFRNHIERIAAAVERLRGKVPTLPQDAAELRDFTNFNLRASQFLDLRNKSGRRAGEAYRRDWNFRLHPQLPGPAQQLARDAHAEAQHLARDKDHKA